MPDDYEKEKAGLAQAMEQWEIELAKASRFLPKRGEEVSVVDMIALCRLHGKQYLAYRVQKVSNELRPFKSDGCTLCPDRFGDIDLYPLCFWHDVAYWVGGTLIEKLEDDCELAVGVARVANSSNLGLMVLAAVTAGGSVPCTNWRWGFGRK